MIQGTKRYIHDHTQYLGAVMSSMMSDRLGEESKSKGQKSVVVGGVWEDVEFTWGKVK